MDYSGKNSKYNQYVFEYAFLEKIFYYIEIFATSFSVIDIQREKNKINLNQYKNILLVVQDLIIFSDKALKDNNMASFVACSSMLNEYILKFSLLFSACKDETNEIDALFHKWKDVNTFKLVSKVFKNLELAKKINLNEKNYIKLIVLFNDFKHLKNINIIDFHNKFAIESGENIDGNGAWVDHNAYQFGVMENLFKTLEIFLLSCYNNNPEQLTSSDYIDHLDLGLKPPLNSQYLCAPWFKEYVNKELKAIKTDLLNGDYLKCFEIES